MRLRLIIMNAIYAITSGVCLFFLLTQTFINVGLGYTISRETINSTVGAALQIDSAQVVDEKGVNLKINIKISSMMCFQTALSTDAYAYTKEKVIDKNIEDITATIREPLSKVEKIATIKALSVQMKVSIYGDIYQANPSADRDQLTASVGINDEYLDSISESVYNKINGNTPTFSDSMTVVYTAFNEMYSKLKAEEPAFDGKQVDSDKKQQLDEQIAQPLAYLGWVEDDDYEILGEDSALCVLIAKIFGLDTESKPGGGGAEPLLLNGINAEQEDATQTNSFADLVKDLIYEKIDPAGSTVGLVFRIIGIIHMFMVVSWGLLALFCILKSLFKNPGIFIGIFFWLTFILEIILGIVFVFVLPLLRNVVGMIPVIGAQISAFIKPFTLATASSTTIPAFCSLGIFLTMIIFYRRWKRKRRDEI